MRIVDAFASRPGRRSGRRRQQNKPRWQPRHAMAVARAAPAMVQAAWKAPAPNPSQWASQAGAMSSPSKRYPVPCTVWIMVWSTSPSAARNRPTHLVRLASVTIRPGQSASMICSLDTTWPRLARSRDSKDIGRCSSGTSWPLTVRRWAAGSKQAAPKWIGGLPLLKAAVQEVSPSKGCDRPGPFSGTMANFCQQHGWLSVCPG